MKLLICPLWLLLPFLILASLPGRAQNPSALIQFSAQGRLQYVPDARGNTVPDFSGVGYRNGEVVIPTVPVAVTIGPVTGDNRARIQAAIDLVSALPLNASGFRGAVLLTAGLYGVNGPLIVGASGVVLRGQGAGPTDHAIGDPAKAVHVSVVCRRGRVSSAEQHRDAHYQSVFAHWGPHLHGGQRPHLRSGRLGGAAPYAQSGLD